jgi:ribosomal protein S18 acetylase RimI-like enzyme
MNEIRELTIDHLDEAIDLFISVFSKEPWNDKYESRNQVVNYFNQFRNNNYFKGFVLIADGKIIGLSLGLLSPSLEGVDYFIHEFCIDSNFQGQKLGSSFLTSIEKEIAKENVKQLILTTAKNYPAVYFYKENGFKVQENSILLTKII